MKKFKIAFQDFCGDRLLTLISATWPTIRTHTKTINYPIFSFLSKIHVIAALFCLAYSSALSQQLKISLQVEDIPDQPGTFAGISNLFFTKIDSLSNFSFPSDWKGIEADQLIRNTAVEPVYIFRIKTGDEAYEYYADLNNDKKITKDDQLIFTSKQADKIADFKIRAKNISSGELTRPVPYQLIRSGKYVYGRIKEQRTGILNLNDQTYKVMVRPFSRSSVYYSTKDAKIFIDFNKDGEISQRGTIQDGHFSAGEQVSNGEPFKIGDKGFVVDSVEENGDWLTIKPFASQEALAVDYKIPPLKLSDIDGNILPKTAKKYTLIELWSTTCPYCESIRTKLNELFGETNSQVEWIAVSREDKPTVKKFLTSHPINAKIVIPKGNDWQYLNPLTATPLFYLVKNDGTIIFKGEGATMVDVIKVLTM